MRIFIGMETSGEARRRLAAQGHHVISCDILPSEDDAPLPTKFGRSGHIVADVFATLEWLWSEGWWPDTALFHPTCTYLTGSAEWAYKDPDFARYPGVGYHQKLKQGTLFGAARREARDKDAEAFLRLARLPIPRKFIENPVGVMSTRFRKPTQIIQPYEFGDDASKKTCIWIVGKDMEDLVDLKLTVNPDKRFPGRWVEWPRNSGTMVERWSNQTESGQSNVTPDEERWKDRSRTFPGIADALTEAMIRS